MKSSTPLSLLLLALIPTVRVEAAAPAIGASWVQTPATVKTKVKPAGQPASKSKTTTPPTAADAPSDAVIDAKANALTANMQKNLALSPAQTEKVRLINRRGVDNVESAHVRYRTDPRKLAGAIETIGRSRLEALKDVLAPAQFDKYQRKREEKMGVPNSQGVQGTPPPGLGSNQ